LNLLVSDFESFDDRSFYKNEEIYFYKRAQLLIADIYQIFQGRGYGYFQNIEELTACADYKLPQVLRRYNILSYSSSLSEKVDNLVLIPKGSDEEIEIRANTIWAIEFLKQEMAKIGKFLPSFAINDHLWLIGQQKLSEDKPYHRTLTTAY